MTDTNTQAPADQETTNQRKARNVAYTLEIVDKLPDPAPRGPGGGGSGQPSPFEPKLATIKGDSKYHWNSETETPWILIAKYGNGTAATAAKNVLQQRHGRSENVEGFAFRTRPIPGEDEKVRGLFVKYDPNAVVPGAKEQHEKEERERVAKLKAKRAQGQAVTTTEGTAEVAIAPNPTKAAATPASAPAKAASAKK